MLAKRFYSGLEHLSMLMNKKGINIDPYPEDPDRNIFNRYDEARQIRVLKNLEDYIEICESAFKDNLELKDSRAFTWKILEYMKFSVKDDVINQEVEPWDIVEIYGMDNRLMFASIQFFTMVSYSLQDLYTKSWEELYHRDADITMQLFNESQKILTGQVTETLYLNIPKHWVYETQSPKKLGGWSQAKLFSPIYQDGKLAGFLDIATLHA